MDTIQSLQHMVNVGMLFIYATIIVAVVTVIGYMVKDSKDFKASKEEDR